jgi:copper chaperone
VTRDKEVPVVKTAKIPVDGISTNSEIKSVEKALGCLEGVRDVAISLEEKLARVTFDETTASLESIREAIRGAGFESMEP